MSSEWLNSCEGWHSGMKLCKRGYCSAKHRYTKYPSAYANAHASSVCQGKVSDPSGVTEADSVYMDKLEQRKETGEKSDLQRWFQEKWVNVCPEFHSGADHAAITKDKGDMEPCGRSIASTQSSDYPYCRPMYRIDERTPKTVSELSKDELREMCKKKRAIQPGLTRSPRRVYVSSLDGKLSAPRTKGKDVK